MVVWHTDMVTLHTLTLRFLIDSKLLEFMHGTEHVQIYNVLIAQQ